ncbi:hypothetical protein MRB53_037277 [Persea americana]|nr:hypothetical protein MRB53_037277 [Persea americana]
MVIQMMILTYIMTHTWTFLPETLPRRHRTCYKYASSIRSKSRKKHTSPKLANRQLKFYFCIMREKIYLRLLKWCQRTLHASGVKDNTWLPVFCAMLGFAMVLEEIQCNLQIQADAKAGRERRLGKAHNPKQDLLVNVSTSDLISCVVYLDTSTGVTAGMEAPSVKGLSGTGSSAEPVGLEAKKDEPFRVDFGAYSKAAQDAEATGPSLPPPAAAVPPPPPLYNGLGGETTTKAAAAPVETKVDDPMMSRTLTSITKAAAVPVDENTGKPDPMKMDVVSNQIQLLLSLKQSKTVLTSGKKDDKKTDDKKTDDKKTDDKKVDDKKSKEKAKTNGLVDGTIT